MRYAVRITMTDGTTYIEENFSHSNPDIAKEWLPAALAKDGAETAEVVAQYTDEERDQYFRRFKTSIYDYGERETLKLVEDVLSGMPIKAKVHRVEQHPAFQLISRSRQQAIHYHHDWDSVRYLARKLLSSLAVEKEMRPVSQRASDNVWRKVIHELKSVLYQSKTVEVSRAQRESRKLANRAERHAKEPSRGVGKGGKKS